ncbi:MAG: hypothetical protein A49_03720 [Methyloceanibacter sp.]|nr:MAG: hypothetical protein A49_03720 [Methyloceanibacter sp.]
MLYLDLETYNHVDIKVGTYRYAETAQVLLFAYAFDDGPVAVWDRAAGETMPSDLSDGLRAGNVLLTAHNAMFDRTIMRLSLGIETGVERWRCTMVKAYSHALPGSLEACGAVLGLPKNKAKLGEGKKLVNRFCRPPPKNHKADRYDRHSHPAEWARFKQYAAQDIEAMREIDRRLPDWNWQDRDIALYHLDQRINDRGFCVDQELTAAGARAAVDEKARMETEFATLAAGRLERPTQRDKFCSYLNQRFGLGIDNTRAETFRELLKDDSLDPDCRRLLELSIQFNKTSTAKYAALAPAVSSDGRFRGGLQFRGAARTRRWCLTGDHEVLTEDGWVRIDQWNGGVIAQWWAGTVSFEHADRVAFDYEGDLIAAQRTGRIDAVMTPEHVLCANGGTGRRTAGAAYGGHVTGVERFGVLRREPISTIRTRVLVMLQHDGFKQGSTVAWNFAKKRKSTRCQKLLAAAGIPFTTGTKTDGQYRVYVPTATKPDWLVKRDFGPWLLHERHDPRAFIAEIEHWDGGNRRDKQIEVCTKKRVNAEWTATMAHLAGFSATVTQRANGYWLVNVSKSGNRVSIKPDDWSKQPFKGRVYCAATRTGFFLVRRNGVVHVTGNSGRNFQPQNLPSRGLPKAHEVDLYIEALKADCHEFLFDDLMLFGSAALRGVVVAPEGKSLAVADLSNIEGRVLAWLAGERWKLQAFFEYDAGRGPDLYNITATSILGGDPYKVSKENRNAFGKVPDLAFGYAGGYGACQTFAKAYGLKLFDQWETITANVDPELIASARANYTKWGADREPDADEDEWIASDVVKLAWRSRHPKTVQLWKACQEAAKLAIQNPGKVYRAGSKLQFAMKRHAGIPYLLMRLPSGGFLVYSEPRYHEDDDAITYMGIDATATGGQFGKWTRLYTYGGKFVENACQSLAMDIMASNMREIDASGFPIILSVHDELVTEPTNGGTGAALATMMAKAPDWLPDFPLAAAGFDTARYRKE